MNEIIAIVDDEEDIVELVSLHLKKNNYNTLHYYKAGQFLKSLEENRPDLIILDLMIPEVDGLEVCREVRRSSEVPIIMLTARQEDADKLIGPVLGCCMIRYIHCLGPRCLIRFFLFDTQQGNIIAQRAIACINDIDNIGQSFGGRLFLSGQQNLC